MPQTKTATLMAQVRDRAAFILAVALTAAWLIFVAAYVGRLGWAGVMGLPIGDAASLMAAAAGPIAALWLIVAVVEQRRETAELRRRMGTGDGCRLMLQDLAMQTAAAGGRLNIIKPDALDLCWARFGAGDFAAFAQPFLDLAATHPDLGDRAADAAARDPSIAAALATMARSYQRLIGSAGSPAERDLFDHGPLGQLHRLLCQGRADGSR